jgi:hypothetical protein
MTLIPGFNQPVMPSRYLALKESRSGTSSRWKGWQTPSTKQRVSFAMWRMEEVHGSPRSQVGAA